MLTLLVPRAGPVDSQGDGLTDFSGFMKLTLQINGHHVSKRGHAKFMNWNHVRHEYK
jgi:hypothetical protein